MKNTSLQLEDLKVSNLPELQGWREKQEKLVEENPYVEIIDNKTYEIACKNRTSLLKGRTELEKQDKLIASKVASFRKEVKTETDNLIAITFPSEEKQQIEVKRYEGIKEQERLDKARLEQERVDTIKSKVDAIETDCFEIIQSMTFQTIIPDGASIALICKTDFDFEEYEVLYHQALLRIENATSAKIDDLNEREEQRIAKEKAEAENILLKQKQDLQSKRLNELLPFNGFGSDIDMATLCDLSEFDYNAILSEKTSLFDAKNIADKEAQDKLNAENLERENKAKADKEAIFEIRKSRFLELEIELNGEYFMNTNGIVCNKRDVFNADAIDFETIITDAKLDIERAKSDLEEAETQKAEDLKLAKEIAKKLKSENKWKEERLCFDKENLALEIGFFDLVFKMDTSTNQETIDFIEKSKVKIQSLKNELLTELNNL